MKWPFVSRLAFEREQLRADSEHENAQCLRRDIANLVTLHQQELAAERARFDALLAKYHERTESPLAIAAKVVPSDPLGPKARAALNAIGKGLSRDVREAMEARAVDMARNGVEDGHVADAVRRGEPLRIA